MKILKKIGMTILTALAVLDLLLSAGTVFYKIPVLGSMANHITIAMARMWLIFTIVLFVFSLLLFAGKLKKKEKARLQTGNLVMTLVALVFTVITVSASFTAVKKAGADISFFAGAHDTSGVKTETVTYTTSEYGDVDLNVYYMDDEATGKPVFFYTHGGGWTSGEKESGDYYCEVFVKNGYVAVSVDYDLSTEERHLASFTEPQLMEAYLWVNEHIAEYGGDPKAIYSSGDSAGGNLTLEMAYKINSGIYTMPNGEVFPQVKAVAVVYPVASPETFYENNDAVMGSMARTMAYSYTGTTPEENPEIYDSIKPANSITEQTPPTFILVGEADSLVPPQATYELAQNLSDAGINNLLVRVPYANHMCDTQGSYISNAFINLSLKWFESTDGMINR